MISSSFVQCLLIIIYFNVHTFAMRCLDENDIGTTLPREDINIEPSAKFNITCILDMSVKHNIGYNSQDLYFTNDFNDGEMTYKRVVPKHKYSIVNDSAIMLFDSLEAPVHHIYSCRLNTSTSSSSAICMNSINVGYLPLSLENLSCVSYNWKGLNCSWQVPYNAIETTYELVYVSSPVYHKKCTKWINMKLPDPLSNGVSRCEVPDSAFRKTHEEFSIGISATNALGNITFDPIWFNTYANVIPNPPRVIVDHASSGSVQIIVGILHPVLAFPKPIRIHVSFQSVWDTQPVVKEGIILSYPLVHEKNTLRQETINIFDLFPYTEYEVFVKIRSNMANGEMWSDISSAKFSTKPTSPSMAPAVETGSFKLVDRASSRDLYIYWKPVHMKHHNGPNFSYCIQDISNLQKPMQMYPDMLGESFAYFTNIVDSSSSFVISGCNSFGSSPGVNLFIPGHKYDVDHPHYVTVIAKPYGRYDVLWKLDSRLSLRSFTVFWCQLDSELPFRCGELLGWMHVDGTKMDCSLNMPDLSGYPVVAVAANYDSDLGAQLVSSGMVWSDCNVQHNSDPAQLSGLKPGVITGTSISVSFQGGCSTPILTDKYIVDLCLLSEMDECLDDPQQLELDNQGSTHVTIDNLRLYTRYSLKISSMIKGVVGKWSLPLTVRTSASKPSYPPTVVKVQNISSLSIETEWSGYQQADGPVDWFEINVANGLKLAEPLSVKVGNASTYYVINNLLPFVLYTVRVRACNTVGCSPYSNELSARTSPGRPGPMKLPVVQLVDGSFAHVQWEPPIITGSLRPVYIIEYVPGHMNDSKIASIARVEEKSDTKLEVPQCLEDPDSQYYMFRIHATTLLANGQLLHGPWTRAVKLSCLPVGWTTAQLVGILLAGALIIAFIFVLVFWICHLVRRKLDKMRGIKVNLPSGLDRMEKSPLVSLPPSDQCSDGGWAGCGLSPTVRKAADMPEDMTEMAVLLCHREPEDTAQVAASADRNGAVVHCQEERRNCVVPAEPFQPHDITPYSQVVSVCPYTSHYCTTRHSNGDMQKPEYHGSLAAIPTALNRQQTDHGNSAAAADGTAEFSHRDARSTPSSHLSDSCLTTSGLAHSNPYARVCNSNNRSKLHIRIPHLPGSISHDSFAPSSNSGGDSSGDRDVPHVKFSPYIDAKAIQALMSRDTRSLSCAPGGSDDRRKSERGVGATSTVEPSLLIVNGMVGGQRSSTGYGSMTSEDGSSSFSSDPQVASVSTKLPAAESSSTVDPLATADSPYVALDAVASSTSPMNASRSVIEPPYSAPYVLANSLMLKKAKTPTCTLANNRSILSPTQLSSTPE